MQYLCEEIKNGIKIARVFGYDGIVEIPESLMGKPVTELGAYIFSDRMDRKDLEGVLQSGILCTEDGKILTDVDNIPEISGTAVKEVLLPQSICRVGRYAFYNCRNLEKIAFGGKLHDLGAGALTSCHQVKFLTVFLEEDRKSCLREMVSELPETLCVTIKTKEDKGTFWFPEFFEEGVENTPARILENHVHGSGIRYRNCFQNKVLDIAEYDEIFPYAIAWEQEQVVLRLALGRILEPLQLTEKAETRYCSYLKEHFRAAAGYLGNQKEYGSLCCLLDMLKPDRNETEVLLEDAQKQGDSIWAGILMDRLNQFGRRARRSFDL